MSSPVERLNGSSLLVQAPTRKNTGAQSATMRKYQQLALAVVSVISLMAFLFYKHEYDRLRYTLEYLEMFGNTGEFSSSSYCGGTANRKLNTAPHFWVRPSADILIYSLFWDEGSGLAPTSVIRTIAIVKKLEKPHTELQSRLWVEGSEISSVAVCSVEEIKPRSHGASLSPNSDIKLLFIVCKPETNVQKNPYLAQFRIGEEEKWSSPILVQESEGWKSVENITCACVFSSSYPVSTVRVVEFISYYNILGVEKFVFFGPLLTPLVRKLLDKYGDESNIYYEEKLFDLPTDYNLNEEETKTLIEKDCLYRHRSTHENVIILKLNEFLMPRTRKSLQEILSVVGGHNTASISEFHFVSQRVCLDLKHSEESNLLLESQIRSLSINKESGSAVIRPHLLTSKLSFRTSSVSYSLHVPTAIANVYSFETCKYDGTHIESDHLPTHAWLVDLIKKSILYRKWKVY